MYSDRQDHISSQDQPAHTPAQNNYPKEYDIGQEKVNAIRELWLTKKASGESVGERLEIITEWEEKWKEAWRRKVEDKKSASTVMREISGAQLNWFRGGIPGKISKLAPTNTGLKKDTEKKLNIPTKKSEEFAYLIGLCIGLTRTTGKRNDWQVTLRGEPQRKDILKALKFAFGEDHPSIKKVDNLQIGQSIKIGGKQLIGFFTEHCDSGNRVPFNFLLSLEERLAFLKGFFDSGSGSYIQDEKIAAITRGNFPILMEGIAVLFKSFDIYPTVKKFGNVRTLRIVNSEEQDLLLELGIVRQGKFFDALNSREVETEPIKRRRFSPKSYYLCMNIACTMPGYPQLQPKDVLKEVERLHGKPVEVDEHNIYSWLKGHIPNTVKRYDVLLDLELELVDAPEKKEDKKRISSRFKSTRNHDFTDNLRRMCQIAGNYQILSYWTQIDPNKIYAALHHDLHQLDVIDFISLYEYFGTRPIQDDYASWLQNYLPQRSPDRLFVEDVLRETGNADLERYYFSSLWTTAKDAYANQTAPGRAILERAASLRKHL